MQRCNFEPTRILLVVDWDADPAGVVAECRRRASTGPTRFALVVPARLPGMDWFGDPAASCPCAARQLDEVTRAAAGAGLDVDSVGVGAPEVVTAVADALVGRAVDQVLLCSASAHRIRPPLDVVWRLRRSTRLPVWRARLQTQHVAPRRRTWFGLTTSHCQVGSELTSRA